MENGIHIFIEERPQFINAILYVYDRENDYTLQDGKIVTTKRSNMAVAPRPFLEAPMSFIAGIAEGMAKHLEAKGGISTDQLNRGRIEQLTKETDWLRGMIEHKWKTNPVG